MCRTPRTRLLARAGTVPALGLVLFLSACGPAQPVSVPATEAAPPATVGAAVEEPVTSAPADAGTEAAALAPTAAVVEEATVVQASDPVDWTQTVTAEGDYYVLGNPAAPLRLIDYSDFL